MCLLPGAIRNERDEHAVKQAIAASRAVCALTYDSDSRQLRFAAQEHPGTTWLVTLAGANSTCTCPQFKKAGFCKHLAHGLLQHQGHSDQQLYRYAAAAEQGHPCQV
jgi:hypothetical protein